MKEITTTAVIKRDNLKVIRLEMQAGAALAEHDSKAQVVIICVKGTGKINIQQTAHALYPGAVLEMEPRTVHSVKAETNLEIMVIQMHLSTNERSGNA